MVQNLLGFSMSTVVLVVIDLGVIGTNPSCKFEYLNFDEIVYLLASPFAVIMAHTLCLHYVQNSG